MSESTQDLRPSMVSNYRYSCLHNNHFTQDNPQLVQMGLCFNSSHLNKVVINSQAFRSSIIKRMKICPLIRKCSILFPVKFWDHKLLRFSKIAITCRKILSSVIIMALWIKT